MFCMWRSCWWCCIVCFVVVVFCCLCRRFVCVVRCFVVSFMCRCICSSFLLFVGIFWWRWMMCGFGVVCSIMFIVFIIVRLSRWLCVSIVVIIVVCIRDIWCVMWRFEGMKFGRCLWSSRIGWRSESRILRISCINLS